MRFRLQTSILTSARWRCLRRDMALACHFLSAGAADRPCLTQPPCAGSCPPAAATNRTTEGGPTGTCSIGEHDPPPTSNRHLTVKEVCWRNGPPFGMVSSSFFPGGGDTLEPPTSATMRARCSTKVESATDRSPPPLSSTASQRAPRPSLCAFFAARPSTNPLSVSYAGTPTVLLLTAPSARHPPILCCSCACEARTSISDPEPGRWPPP